MSAVTRSGEKECDRNFGREELEIGAMLVSRIAQGTSYGLSRLPGPRTPFVSFMNFQNSPRPEEQAERSFP